MGMNPIELATLDNPIEIIPENIVNEAIGLLRTTFIRELSKIKSGVVIPIEKGGHEIGKYLCDPGEGIHLEPNPMKMSHYGEKGKYLEKPICKSKPKIEGIIDIETGLTRDVFFAEAVVESQETIIEAQIVINQMIDEYNELHPETHYEYPTYHTIALISKTSTETKIDNFIYAFKVDKNIWVRGQGCDDKGKGRQDRAILGRIGENATETPFEPYYRKSDLWD
jgi:hypothetical protein